MPDEFAQQPQQQQPSQEREEKLRNYGPTVLGGLIVLAIIVSGIWFWQSKKATSKPAQVTSQQQNSLPLPSPTPIPYPSFASPSPKPAFSSPAPVSTATPRPKAEKLPQTGFPILPFAAVSLGMMGTGLILRRFSSH